MNENENKNNDIKFEDLVDNYNYQQNNNQSENNNQGYNGQGGFSSPYGTNPFWSQQTPQEPKSNGYNIASLVLGILSIVCCCIPVFAPAFAVLAILFFVFAKKRGNANGMAIAGLICGIFGLILGLINTIDIIVNFDEFMHIIEEAGTTLVL